MDVEGEKVTALVLDDMPANREVVFAARPAGAPDGSTDKKELMIIANSVSGHHSRVFLNHPLAVQLRGFGLANSGGRRRHAGTLPPPPEFATE